MPTLLAVRYRLLEGEQSAVDAAASNVMHDFGGELVLVFDGGLEVFVSWASDPVQYCIGTNQKSHFVADANLSDHDVTDSAMWSALAGRDVAYVFLAEDHQVLEISSTDDRLYICSFERGEWCSDEVAVCRIIPAADGV